MTFSTEQLCRCELKLREALLGSWRARVAGLDEGTIDRMADACMIWTTHSYRRNNVGDSLRRDVKKRFKNRYGSIWTMLLFSLIWKVIEKWLFD